MPLTRRAAGSAIAWASCLRAAAAADYPTQDIHFIIPYGAGGGFDLEVRAISPAMQQALPGRVQIVPDNVPTGGGVLGVSQVYRARPDGYTIGVMNIPGLFVLQRGGGAAFDLDRFAYIGSMGRDVYGIGVANGSALRSMDDLTALSAQRPIKFTTTGREGTAFSATVIGAKLLGLRTSFIAGYKGANDYVVAAIRGDGDAVVATLPLLKQMQQGGLLRILATFETQSSVQGAADATSLGQPKLSDIVLERVVVGPPRLPPAIQAMLSTALAKAMTAPEVMAWAAKIGSSLKVRTPEETKSLVMEQSKFYETWKGLLDAA